MLIIICGGDGFVEVFVVGVIVGDVGIVWVDVKFLFCFG